MKKLPLLMAVAAGLTLAACDNNLPPTKAPADQTPQVDNNPVPKSITGGGQAATPPTQ